MDDDTRWPPPERTSTAAPLYLQVRERVEALALATPLGAEQLLPPEPQLVARFGVSRGTLRRALDDLARDGLLRIEPGRGTFVVTSAQIRRLVRERLLAVARPDSRFHLDVEAFVPDFTGRERCDDQLLALPEVAGARTLFVAPDNSLEAFRASALRQGKHLVVPTYGMRRGFVSLRGADVPSGATELAATLDGMERWGAPLDLDGIRALGGVDAVVTGATALTRQGLMVGGGRGFLDLEWALLLHCAQVTAATPVIASVHDCQVLDADVPPGRHDLVADVVVTPSSTRRIAAALPKPTGINWDELSASAAHESSYVAALLAEAAVDRMASGGAAGGLR